MVCCQKVTYLAFLAPPTLFLMPNQRTNIGGKLLTNYLKELVSFRQWYMMEDTYVMNAAKEACCYVSLDVDGDQDICKFVIFPSDFSFKDHV